MTVNIQIQNIPNQPQNVQGPMGAAFLLMITSIFTQKANLDSSAQDYPKDYTEVLVKKCCTNCFDFIVVGAGPAGAIIANRLTEDENWTVLLVEAGNYPTPSSEVPAFHSTLPATEEDWNFQTEPEKNACQGLKKKRCRISRGKAIGGTSSINNLHYIRGTQRDFEKWPDNPQYGWTHEQIFKNYDTIEKNITLSPINVDNEYKDLIFEGGRLMGYHKSSGGAELGYMEVKGTINRGTRENIAKTFLKDIKSRGNLAMIPNAMVTKILTKLPLDRRIQGVSVRIRNKDYTVIAKKELILAAGAINNAHLLLLSGFGPKEHLKKMKIPVVVDTNIGKQFRDQLSTLVFVGLDKGKEFGDKSSQLVDETFSYMMHRKGELTQTNINDIIGFINTKQDGVDIPNIMIYHYLFRKDDPDLEHYLDSLGFVDKTIRSILNENKNEPLLLLMPTLIKPESYGEIELKSLDPFQHPSIKANFLSDIYNDDYNTLLSGVKYVLEMIETQPFKDRGAHFLEIDMPMCRNYKYCNEPYLGCVVKTMSVPRSQPIGTVAFGNLVGCDPCRVLDEHLLIDGIRHLRVVDGSAMVSHVSGSLEATVAMMAENAAKHIKTTWMNSKSKSLKCNDK